MESKRVLFISGSIGLGHIGRDLAIAKALRRRMPEVEIFWLAQDPASMVLSHAGEKLLPEAALLAQENVKLENSARGYEANLINVTLGMRKGWAANARLIGDLVKREHFDLVVGDETYDLLIETVNNPSFKTFAFVMIYGFIGVDSVTHSPVDLVGTYMINRLWVNALKANPPTVDRSLFIGEVEDVPDRKFGFMLPNRRELAQKSLDFVGYVLSFNPQEYADKSGVKRLLGYGDEPLVVCSIGGTSAGRELLDLCAQVFPLIREQLPNVRMVLVCGPRLSTDSVKATDGLEVKGYVPELFKHFAAADLCIVTGGGTATLELIALQKSFLYFPLRKYFEQMTDVASRCQRYKAGVRMDFAKTTPELLAETVLAHIGKKVSYAAIRTGGAENAADIISEVLEQPWSSAV